MCLQLYIVDYLLGESDRFNLSKIFDIFMTYH
ncbi:hypothetical protein PEDI_50610 [Persicobacter diffluens]|uniref:Uncharacterized protein n=1 Tax=Persicobacter diffluens TaxID=981 RepID=A0AAN5AMJ2_9BACT|nr:hypothetical protein PEDI_50610 [Persicobacter diffluens]